jgi:hypothetical protein
VEFDRVVPASGNLAVQRKQFWLGPARAGVTVTFWADHDVIHLSITSARVKTVRSHLSVNDLAALEIDRTVSRGGTVCLGNHQLRAAEILAGRRVSIRIEDSTLMFFDPDTRRAAAHPPQPARPRPSAETARGPTRRPPPRPSVEPITVQRRAFNSGIITVVGQNWPSAEPTPTLSSPSTSPNTRVAFEQRLNAVVAFTRSLQARDDDG